MTITRVGLVARSALTPALEALTEAAGWLSEQRVEPVVDERSAREAGLGSRYATAGRGDLVREVDTIVTFGGDGTLLDMAGAVASAGANTPILGINLGRLGFLTEARRRDLVPALSALIAGRVRIEPRAVLDGRVMRSREVVADRLALNDVVVTRGAQARMIEIAVSVDGHWVLDVKADGLIVATATGSTAYNLSAGGPIVHPSVNAFVLTPIAPHTLTNRPLVLPEAARIVLTPRVEAQSEIVVTFDGQATEPVHEGDTIKIKRSAREVHLVRMIGRTHFDMLREKLQWGQRLP
ncbi:MAG TPA: NAD(+)/NADH kinase [Vicinamibacterales bacterium]|nr:NAD(+)/NADH kinase [Vicinamibacterales bacterium]